MPPFPLVNAGVAFGDVPLDDAARPLVLGIALGLLVGKPPGIVGGAAGLARRMGVSALLVGLIVVVYGTSAPEVVVGVQAALDGHPDIPVGNVIGSNIFNVL